MGKFKLKKLLFMSSATSSYETKDERNVVSWYMKRFLVMISN
jgi:hypothetical protein